MKKIKNAKLQDLNNSLFDRLKSHQLDDLVSIVGGRQGSDPEATGPGVGEATQVGSNTDKGTQADGVEIKIT